MTTWDQFLNLLDQIVESPPRFYKTRTKGGVTIGEPIGVPVYLILDLIANTSAAFELFQDQAFNRALKDLLNSFGDYLKDPLKDSNANLDANEEAGWFSPACLAVLEAGLGGLSFEKTYKLDPKNGKKYKTWDSFFTREFINHTVRPVQHDPQSPKSRVFVNNACESTVLRFATNVQLHDNFWVKEQNYSLYDMFGGNEPDSLAEFAKNFEGGSVYQAFLGPQDYHRWHSPVKGKITKSKVFNGTYYAVLPDSGAPSYDTDLLPGDPHGALIRSQPWLSVVATRAVYIIEPDPKLNLKWVAFIAIGMAEVSTCEITKHSGEVKAGEEIGTFRFGGSSHTLLLRPKDGYEVVFQDYYETPIRPGQHRWINSAIAQVRPIIKPEPTKE